MEGGVKPGEMADVLVTQAAPEMQQVWKFGRKDGGHNLVSIAIKTKVKKN